jgi:hypothetical protein
MAADGAGKSRKHPRLLTDRSGSVLTIWTEGTGWNRGGDFAWQLLGADGQPTLIKGRQTGIPVWSFASAFQRQDGGFVILY